MHCNSYRTTTSQLQADYELVDGASEVRRLRLVTNPLSLIMAAAISTMWADVDEGLAYQCLQS